MRGSKKTEQTNNVEQELKDKKETTEIKDEVNENRTNDSSFNKEKQIKEALKNIAIGCGFILYMALLLFGKGKISNIDYIKTLKAISICDLLAAIVLIEVAFKKDRFNIGLHGIEMAFMGGFTLFFLDLFCKMNVNLYIWFSIIVGIITLYYLIKATIIAVKNKK